MHGDVGVRFGGSEHHRIGTSSSHTRPPPYGAGTPGQPGQGRRRLSGHRGPGSTGTGSSGLFGGRAARFHRGPASGALRSTRRRTSPGSGTRRFSDHRAPSLTGTGNPRLFGVEGTPPHGTGNQKPFGADGTPPHGTGNQKPFGADGTPPHGTGRPDLFGGSASRFHPGQSPQPLEVGPPAQPGSGRRHSSERREQGLTGQGTRCSSERRAPHPTGAEHRKSSEDRAPSLTGVRQTALFGASRARPRRDREPAALRSRRHPTPPGQGTSGSSEPKAPHPTGQGTGSPSGPTAPHPTEQVDRTSSEDRRAGSTGSGPAPPQRDRATGTPRSPAHPVPPGWVPSPLGARQTALLGASRAGPHGTRQPGLLGAPRVGPHRDREPEALRGRRHPTPSGQGTHGSSESRAPHPTGTCRPVLFGGSASRFQSGQGTPPHGVRQTALLGAPRAEPHRDNARRAPRSPAGRVPPRDTDAPRSDGDSGLEVGTNPTGKSDTSPSGQDRPATRG